MNQNKRTDKRIDHRMGTQEKCIIGNQFSWIETQTIDISKNGIGVKTSKTLPLKFKNGCELPVVIPNMELPPAKIMWTKKDIDNTTRLGLKFSTSIIY